MTSNNDLFNIISSFSSGIITKTSVAPLERIKILKQAQIKYKTNRYQGILQSIRFIVSNEGIKGLYYGNLTNIYRTTPSYIFKFTLNDKFKSLFQTNNEKLTFNQLILMYDQITEAHKKLNQNVNPTLVFEQIVIKGVI